MPADDVLVTGGSGFVGGAVLRHLIDAGRRVRALVRSDAGAAAVEAVGARPIPGDVLDPDAVARAVRGCEVVFHAAGVNALCARDPSPMYRTNVLGSELVVGAAAAARVRRIVYTSSAAVLGEAQGTVGREDSPHRGTFLSHYERSKYLAERRVLAAAEAAGLDLVCVNPSSVQGPGRTGGTARLILDVVNGRLPVAFDTHLSFVDVDDCARGHLLAGSAGAPGARYVLNGATMTTREALRLLEELTGVQPRVRFLPGWAAAVAGELGELAGRATSRRFPLCREAVRTLRHGHRYDGSLAERELGVRYSPPRDTIRRTLDWYAASGLVPPRFGSGSADAAAPGEEPRT